MAQDIQSVGRNQGFWDVMFGGTVLFEQIIGISVANLALVTEIVHLSWQICS